MDIDKSMVIRNELLHHRESQHVEFKQSWRDEYLKWICGFANAHGGILYIGIKDNGEICGIRDAQKLLEDIPNKVKDTMGIIVQVDLMEESDSEYLKITTDAYPSPVSYKGQYHFRSGSTKQELKGAALDKFLLRKYGRTWDSSPVPYVKTEDLSPAIIQNFRTKAIKSKRLDVSVLTEDDTSLIEKLRLYEVNYLNFAAVLLFHPDPERFVTGAYIKIGFFRTDDDLLFQDEIHGDLFTQVEKSLELLTTKYLRANIHYESLQRVEEIPVPEYALREALTNAVVHKDYASYTPIQISVYQSKLMIWNSGVLPEGWTIITLLQKHSSRPYNPNIANAFFRAGDIEAWGRGIERIFSACKKLNAPLPVINNEGSGLWITFPFKEYVSSLNENEYKNKDESSTIDDSVGQKGSTIDDTGSITGSTINKIGSTISATYRQHQILNVIKQNPKISHTEIAIHFKIQRAAVQKHLNALKKKGALIRVGGTHGYWVVNTEK